MALAVSLSQKQVEAANRLHAKLGQWVAADAALHRLHEQVPGFDLPACLLKTIAINSLYGTNILDVRGRAEIVCRTLSRRGSLALEPRLVERIGRHSLSGRSAISFASKFCHFFVDGQRFAIYDEAARRILAFHLGRSHRCLLSYASFCASLDQLRREASLTCGARELDQYLWLVGMYEKWLRERKKPKPAINAELMSLCERPTAAQRAWLKIALPEVLLHRAQREGVL